MKYLKDIFVYNKNKFYIIFGILLAALIGVLIYLYSVPTESPNNNNNNNNYIANTVKEIVLMGSKEINLQEGENYIEPGYYAVTYSGQIKQDEINVVNTIDSSKPGTYVITYTIEDKIARRTVNIIEKKKESVLSFELKGNSYITLKKGEEYIEPGYVAYDTIDGDLTNFVKLSGVVDTFQIGSYTLTYEVENSQGKKIEKTRTIDVIANEIKISISADEQVGKEIALKINITGDNFHYIKYPNNTTSTEKNTTYKATKNGIYKFYIYDTNGNFIEKEITINNLDLTPPVVSCTAAFSNSKTTIKTTASDSSGVTNYTYIDKYNATTNTYTITEDLEQVYVDVQDKYGNSNRAICNVTGRQIPYDYLEMHFIVSGHNDDAILIRTGKAAILIDSGRYNNYKDVIPYLKATGLKQIDAMIGSHPHYNHIQAQAQVISNFTVKNAYYPVDLNTCASKNYCDSNDVKYIKDALKNAKIPTYVKHAGDTLVVGDMTLYFLGPYTLNHTAKYKQNYNSFIFILKYKNNTFMFTGDAPSSVFNLSKIKPYADKLGISLNVDMLKYPHHGNMKIDTDLLSAMTPKYVIVPNYKYSDYPNSTNTKNLTKVGASIYKQSTDLNIVLISDGKNITVKKKQSASSYKR